MRTRDVLHRELRRALGVFLLMVPESACIPIPSEVTLIFSGVAVHQGWMSFPLGVRS